MTKQQPTLKENTGIKPLDEVLLYENENVPHRFKKHFFLSDEEADDIFMETKKWLWFCAVAYELNRLGRIDFIVGIIRGLPMIDQMWHNFILHTQAYEAFCNKYLGGFVHHVPTTKAADESKLAKGDMHVEEMKGFYENQYSLTYDLMGEATCLKWYKEYAEKYSRAEIDKIKKPLAKQQ
ncbi:MAG: hypothetical protein DHS20C18_04880 [Saprospiraceae bacterium]|nr:MAG: hypothetical protein DHS20C18_04880 [Saprospiraceae bacterium]